jgi:hypothetical protein
MRILPDENLDNAAVRDPNRDIAEDRAGIDDLRKTPVGNDAPSTNWPSTRKTRSWANRSAVVLLTVGGPAARMMGRSEKCFREV